MPQELVLKECCDSELKKKFEFLKSVISSITPAEKGYATQLVLNTLETLEEDFDNDYKRVYEVGDLLFGEDISSYGKKCSEVFMKWEDEGGGPSLLSLVAHAWEQFDLGALPYFESALMSGVLGAVPNELQYHGNEHYKKVLFHLIRLIQTQNQLSEKEKSITSSQISSLIICGAIHDLAHLGGDNLRNGIYTPGYMEQRSFDIARPYFEVLGLSSEQLGIIETLIFCTDITFFAGDNSPCVRMRRIYDYYFEDKKDKMVLNFMVGKLKRFSGNKSLALAAMLLHEADVGTSAGLTYAQSIKETIDIIEERGMRSAGPRVLLTFMQDQLGGGMKTQASKALFGPAMQDIMEHATADIDSGRSDFYS